MCNAQFSVVDSGRVYVNGGRRESLALETRTAILGWLVEKDAGRLYNCSFLIDPNGSFVGKYRKVQANLGQRNVRNVDAYCALVDPDTRPAWTEIFFDSEGRPQTREQLLKRFRGRYDAKDPEGTD